MSEQNTQSTSPKEDFTVMIGSQSSDDTVVLTTTELSKKWLETAMVNYSSDNHNYSTYLNETAFSSSSIMESELETLSVNPQSDIRKVKRINDIARYYINKDDLVGKVYETIESNVNTEYLLTYKDFTGNRNKKIQAEKAKELIENFNDQINLKNIIRKSVPLTYSEGNYPLYLRKNKDAYTVDYYPLGVIEVSDYEIDGEPYLLFNVNELKSRLQKVNKKNRDGTFLFFKSIDDEIKNNYPKEVYDAFISKNQYAKLNIKKTGILRINNMNRKYGVTPIFRTFKPALMLEIFETTDKINAQSKGKKIIFQQMRKEILGKDFDKDGFEDMAYAHESFMEAWKNKVVVYTGSAAVESITYVEPKVESTSIELINYNRNKIMTDLGISFLNSDSKGAFASAQISIKELMKLINKITSQLEDIVKKWYKLILTENGFSVEFCPNIKIIDSEMLEMSIKLDMVEFLYMKLNCSIETAYNMLGVEFDNEKKLRREENESGLEEIFAPRVTSYTNSKEPPNSEGAPVKNNDPNKQVQDQDRVKAKKKAGATK